MGDFTVSRARSGVGDSAISPDTTIPSTHIRSTCQSRSASSASSPPSFATTVLRANRPDDAAGLGLRVDPGGSESDLRRPLAYPARAFALSDVAHSGSLGAAKAGQ